MTCPGCKGTGRYRVVGGEYDGEAEDCRICHGKGEVEAFACIDPEAQWIKDVSESRET